MSFKVERLKLNLLSWVKSILMGINSDKKTDIMLNKRTAPNFNRSLFLIFKMDYQLRDFSTVLDALRKV